MSKENAVQDVADTLLTDPDKDARATRAPRPPQTIDAQPASERDRPAR